MITLQTLVDARAEILKAEVAALLHNIGKLDVNFLIAKVVEGQDRESAYREIQERLCDIPDYFFDRFAAPNLGLLIKGRETINKRWGSEQRQQLATALQGAFEGSLQQAAIEALAKNWTKKTKKQYPVVASMVEAAGRFSECVLGNGPLFRCFSPERQKRLDELRTAKQKVRDVEIQIAALDQELAQVHQALDQALEEEKKPLGLHRGRLDKQKKALQREQEQAEKAYRALQLEVPAEEKEAQTDLESQFRDVILSISGEKWPFADLLTLFWDDFFYAPDGDEYQRHFALADWLVPGQGTALPALLILAHGEASGMEKADAPTRQPGWKALRLATAFGHEPSELAKWTFHDSRHQLIEEALRALSQPAALRDDFQKRAQDALGAGTGDTRWPFNEITLWDYSTSIATLLKATVAKAVLENRFVELKQVKWCLLHISFDGPAFWGQAHHVTDLLGRRKVLQEGLDAIRDILEVRYPLGNEAYRDEHGSVFVVPNVEDLLKLEDENGASLRKLLEEDFDARGIRGELVPEIKVSEPYKGKEIKLAQVLKKRRRKNIPKPDVAAGWWAEGQRPANAEICTVCGQRPVGYPAKGSAHERDLQLDPWADQGKAENRNVCRVCLQRRGRRAWDWTRNKKTAEEKLGPFERTIWTDEVADDNGRFALVVGRFALDGWLDGKLIPTMRKSASFARIRRCWDTTRRFWLEVQDEELPKCAGRRLRLGLRPVNVEAINHRDPKKGLGRWHTYEADVGGRRLGLCWDSNDKDADDRNLFWTTDNLRYLGRQLGFKEDDLKTEDKMVAEWLRRLNGHTLPLYEPGGYLGQERRANVDAEGCVVIKQEHFHPFVPLMIEPATFMALVPADKALVIAEAIKAKYDTEMARVRDRLPLHLGLVFAPRRTPLAAVLEAGRAMLTMPDGWEKWQIEAQGREATFSRDGQTFDWKYPAKMGDNQTDDVWYSHLLTIDPTEKAKELDRDAGDFCLVDDLTGTVFIRPSRFDFEFLDTTARRFEIAYQTSEVSETSEVYRPSRRTRPFLLDDLERLETLWTELCYLEKSQRHQVISTIEGTREAWFGADRKGQSLTDGVFRQFVRDTLAGAAWPERRRWKDICQAKTDKQLVTAGVAGELADLAELHMEILKE